MYRCFNLGHNAIIMPKLKEPLTNPSAYEGMSPRELTHAQITIMRHLSRAIAQGVTKEGYN